MWFSGNALSRRGKHPALGVEQALPFCGKLDNMGVKTLKYVGPLTWQLCPLRIVPENFTWEGISKWKDKDAQRQKKGDNLKVKTVGLVP